MALFKIHVTLIKKILVFLLLAITVVLVYSNLNGSIPLYKLLFYHIIVLVSNIFLLLVIGRALLQIKINVKILNYFYGVICGLFFTLILLSYILAFVGKKVIGIPIRFQVFWVYLKHPSDTIQALGISPILTYTFCIGLPLLIISFFIYCSKYLLTEILKLQSVIIIFIRSKSVINRCLKVILLIVSIGVVIESILLFNSISFSERLNLAKEPIFQVYFGENIIGINLSKNVEPLNSRRNYPKYNQFKKKHIILIIVDALRADYLNLYGYPNKTTPFLSQLYKEGALRKIDYVFSTSAASFLEF